MKTILLAALLLLTNPHLLMAQDAPIPARNVGADSLALQGYDPVAYFAEGAAREGLPAHTAVFEGVSYHFVSAANKAAFLENPAAYLPQYGGWCAFGLGMDADAYDYPQGPYPVDPRTFKVVDGKLYLFYNQEGFNALDHWNRDEETTRARADAFWKSHVEQ